MAEETITFVTHREKTKKQSNNKVENMHGQITGGLGVKRVIESQNLYKLKTMKPSRVKTDNHISVIKMLLSSEYTVCLCVAHKYALYRESFNICIVTERKLQFHIGENVNGSSIMCCYCSIL